MILPIPGGLPEFAKRLPPTKEPIHPPPTREARDLLEKVTKYGGKAISKYAHHKAKGKHSKTTGALKKGVKLVTGYGWLKWLILGISLIVILLLIYQVRKKGGYKKRRAALEAEARAAFEGNNDDNIDPSTIPFNQPWSHRGMAERRAAAEAV
ncbi:hypothetical protein FVEN_g4006 [Fusarium venenatum]|uniref:Uncharacterized protein n=2 Tax=Fusarium venenatum TaxID=56646 RepID=A0A2L2TSK4_9HYPO|nr:uncharacterized protein FVRRES_09318 [Fusarium venenatum]KAG8358276.1 hypothetical protein FVEN_g4006 [Fusarium venenatum]CEI69241.1 unnamed protein product [Fusarium venenatum]